MPDRGRRRRGRPRKTSRLQRLQEDLQEMLGCWSSVCSRRVASELESVEESCQPMLQQEWEDLSKYGMQVHRQGQKSKIFGVGAEFRGVHCGQCLY